MWELAYRCPECECIKTSYMSYDPFVCLKCGSSRNGIKTARKWVVDVPSSLLVKILTLGFKGNARGHWEYKDCL